MQATAAAASTPQNAREEKIALLTAKINDLVEKVGVVLCAKARIVR